MPAHLRQRTPPPSEEGRLWLETLRDTTTLLGPRRDFQEGLRDVLRLLAERHGFLRPHLILFEPESGLLRLSLADTPPKADHADYAPGMGVTGRVFATGKPVLVEKMRGDPLFMSLLFERTDEELDTLAFVSVPVLASGGSAEAEVIGTLNADTPFVSRRDLEWRRLFLEVLASFIATEREHVQEARSRSRRAAAVNPASEPDLPLAEAVARFEKVLLINALIKTGGNMMDAAKELRSSYRIVHYKIKKYGIDPRSFAPKGHSLP